jgi:phytoene dehydrogenase-like protein
MYTGEDTFARPARAQGHADKRDRPGPTRLVVVGGGLAGLWLARRLKEDDPTARVTLLEARSQCGGRVRTSYDAGGAVEYETGPWRVPHTHERVLSLFAELGVQLVAASTPPHHPPTTPRADPDDDMSRRSRRGLETWGVVALSNGGPTQADRHDLETGYADETRSAFGSAPYIAGKAHYFVAPAGFTRMVEALRDATERVGVRVVTDCRVHDLHASSDGGQASPTYRLECTVRTGSTSFKRSRLLADAVFVCVPPRFCREWTVFRSHARSVMAAVREEHLHHVYVRGAHERGVHRVDTASPLLQTVSTQYDNDWYQATYTSGRVATMWYDLFLQSTSEFLRQLRRHVSETVGWDVPASSSAVRSHFWNAAYHVWRSVPDFDLARAVACATRPNPHRLPRVYLAGEAFSSHQAWMEGALETAELAEAAWRDDRARGRYDGPAAAAPPHDRDERTRDVGGGRRTSRVWVEGFRLDTSRWMHKHPGGVAALRDHADEDVTALLDHVMHSDHAWAVVHSLKRLPLTD